MVLCLFVGPPWQSGPILNGKRKVSLTKVQDELVQHIQADQKICPTQNIHSDANAACLTIGQNNKRKTILQMKCILNPFVHNNTKHVLC